MGIPLALLMVEDSESDAELTVYLLKRAGYDVAYERVEAAAPLRAALARRAWDLVIADYHLPQFSAPAALKLLQEMGLDLPFIVVSGAMGEETAVAMMRAGAHDYLMKDNLARLAPAVARELREAEGRRGRKRAETALQRQLQELTVLHAVASACAAAIDEDQLIADISVIVGQALYPDDFGLFLLDAAAGALRPHPSYHQSVGTLRASIPLGEGIIGQVAQDGQPHRVADVRQVQNYIAAAPSTRAELAVPVKFGGRVSAVINTESHQVGYFSANDERLLGTVADQLATAAERIRLHRETRQRAEQQTALNAIITAANRAGADVQALAEVALDHTLAAFGLAMGAVWLKQPVSGGDRIQVMRGFSAEMGAAAQMAGRAQHPLDKVEAVPDWATAVSPMKPLAGRFGFGASLTVPLMAETERIGGLSIASPQPRIWQPDEIALLEVLGRQLGMAMDRARLLTETRRRLAEQEALYKISATVRTAQTLEAALPVLLDETLAALDTDVGAILLCDPASGILETRVARGWYKNLEGDAPIMPGEGITGTVFVSGQAHLSVEFARDPAVRPPVSGEIPPGWGGACVPIRTGAERVGVLLVSVPLPRRITPEQMQLLTSLAEMGGATLHRLRLLAQIQEQVRRTQQILDSLPEGVLLLDAQGRVAVANPAASRELEALAGATVGDVIMRLGDLPLAELLTPETRGPWREASAGGRTFRMIARPVGDMSEPASWVLVISDVTSEREQQRYQQAQERLASVGQMAAGIAHDFNNIMGTITLYAGLLERTLELPARELRYLVTIRGQADHAANLIRQILDFSRRAPMARAPLDLLLLTKELVKLLERTLPESIKLAIKYDHNEFIVYGDPTRLQQVLMNLALNARDAMPNGGRLAFNLATLALAPGQPAPLPDLGPGEWVRVMVSDSGAGIAEEHLPHIFEPFFTTKAPGHGTGLGLAQVYGIVKQHDGAIDVTSRAGAGTTFTIYLPRFLVEVAPVAPAAADAVIPTGRETILLVEDNPVTRGAVGEALEALGYRVRPAATGREALSALVKPGHGVALVLSDMVMPEMGGLELYRRLQVAHPAVKLIFMTGHALAEGGYEEFVQAGVLWLQKPFAMADLAGAIRTVLDAPVAGN